MYQSLYIAIREIFVQKMNNFKGQFTYVIFLLILKKKNLRLCSLFSTFIFITKIFHLGLRDKYFDFISRLPFTSKAKARYLDFVFQLNFPIHHGINLGFVPLSSIFVLIYSLMIFFKLIIVINMVLVLVI